MTEIIVGSAVIVLVVLVLTAGLLVARRQLVPEGALSVTVNETTTIEAQRGAKLLEVLHGAGIGIPAGCGGSGTCGLCRVTVTGPLPRVTDAQAGVPAVVLTPAQQEQEPPSMVQALYQQRRAMALGFAVTFGAALSAIAWLAG